MKQGAEPFIVRIYIDMFKIPFTETLGNSAWLSKNKQALLNILPETWTHLSNINGLQIGFQLKLLGVDWRSEEEFGKVMTYLEKIKFIDRDGVLIRRGARPLGE